MLRRKIPNAEEARGREFAFHWSIVAKGLFAAAEVAGGSALWLLGSQSMVAAVDWLTWGVLNNHPQDKLANAMRHAAGRFAVAGHHFAAIYLLAHGAVKLLLIIALLRRKLWAYPISLVVFGGFVVYQIYRYDVIGGLGLVVLTAIDLVVMWLIWLEYRAMLAHRALAAGES